MYHVAEARPDESKCEIYYQDFLSREWVRLRGPCRWQGNVELDFRAIPYRLLEPAGSWKRPEVVAKWLRRLRQGEPVPPVVVCPTGRGTYYVREGNHRHEALGLFLGDKAETCSVRAAVVLPKNGFRFRYRWFGTYGTYLLEPEAFLPRNNGALRVSPPPAVRCTLPPAPLRDESVRPRTENRPPGTAAAPHYAGAADICADAANICP